MSKPSVRKKIFDTLDPQNRRVEFHNDTWEHIKKDHPEVKGGTTWHPDVKGIKTIRSTVESPLMITHDEPRNALYYADFTISGLYFKVIARIADKTNISVGCTVSTAYLTSDRPRGKVIWQRKK